MELEVQPMPAEDELSAIRGALVRAGIQLDHPPAAYVSAWRRAAAREAVAGLPARSSYALSPRSTRGATRA
jgi:hypothetical protein